MCFIACFNSVISYLVHFAGPIGALSDDMFTPRVPCDSLDV